MSKSHNSRGFLSVFRRTRHAGASSAVFLALFSFATIGCGGVSADGRLAVQGSVSVGGQALERGSILFHPNAGSRGQEAGAVIRDGRYALEAAQGVFPGRYTVEIQPANAPPTGAKAVTIDEITGAEVPVRPTRISRSNPLLVKPKKSDRILREIEVSQDGPNRFDFTESN